MWYKLLAMTGTEIEMAELDLYYVNAVGLGFLAEGGDVLVEAATDDV